MNWRQIWLDSQTGRLRSGWRILIFLLIASLASTVFIFLFSTPIPTTIKDPFLREYITQLIESLAVIPAFLCVSVWAVRTLDRLPARTLGLSFADRWLKLLWIGFGLGIVVIAVTLLIYRVAGLAAIYWHQPDRQQAQVLLLAVISFLVFAAEEEIIFHGYLFQTLLRGVGAAPALFITSAVFAAMHLGNPTASPLTVAQPSPLAIANLFMSGMLFGLLYLRLGSLWLPIGIHAGWNFALLLFQVNISGLHLPLAGVFPTQLVPQALLTGGAYGPEGGLAISVVLLGAIALVARSRRGLPLSSSWWEWRNLLTVPQASTPWDFTIDNRYYQWKLLGHDQAE